MDKNKADLKNVETLFWMTTTKGKKLFQKHSNLSQSHAKNVLFISVFRHKNQANLSYIFNLNIPPFNSRKKIQLSTLQRKTNKISIL